MNSRSKTSRVLTFLPLGATNISQKRTHPSINKPVVYKCLQPPIPELRMNGPLIDWRAQCSGRHPRFYPGIRHLLNVNNLTMYTSTVIPGECTTWSWDKPLVKAHTAIRSTMHEKRPRTSVVVETVSETSHLCWNNETIRFKSSLTSIIIESTYLTLNMNKTWGCFEVQVGWKKCILWGNWVSKMVSNRSRRDPDH